MANQKKMAQDLGLSVATVSNALSGKGRVSQDVVKLVTSHAKDVGYFPSAAGRALKTGRSGILGLVMPDITKPVFPEFAHAVETEADKCGFGVLIANARGSADGQEKAIQQLIQRGVDGIIILPQRGSSLDITEVPCVVLSTQPDPQNTVAANHRQGGALSAQAMLDLGHRKFLLLGDDSASPVQQERIAGMLDALDRVEHDVFWASERFPDLLEQSGKGTTAVLTVSDLLALRVVSEASRSGLSCPGAISVVGFDDLPLATAVRPTLSTIVPNTPELSRRAVACLDAVIRKNTEMPAPSVVDMSLMMRESTGPVPSNAKPSRGK